MRDDIALREFHVSRDARDNYQFDETLFALSGNVVFANFYAARLFAQKMNNQRDLVNFPERAVRAGQINAIGLIDEILHLVIGRYRDQRNPDAMQDALVYLEATLGREAMDAALRTFTAAFPPLTVYRNQETVDSYLHGETDGISHREVALEELLLLWLANSNPAFAPFLELFDDSRIVQTTAYPQIIASLDDFFQTQPRFGPDNQTLIALLRAPALRVPGSLQGQLDYLRESWIGILGTYLYRLLGSLDFLSEEEKPFFGFGPGPSEPYVFDTAEFEAENFSADSAWMPRLVLIAKNAYVWLDQLTTKYGRPIKHLDEVPDEELDTLARWGISGLWLIGLWQRSAASQRIKQMMGNPDAVASAYSLQDYRIADDLGGEAAYDDLKARAWQRGTRMASDMVPNHVGIDAAWVIEHPDWFVRLPYSPFPAYSFTGVDLSTNDRVGIYLEDHYYDRTDAAVVFRRVDHWTGDTVYIYHGNDGTSMPWNDTAQLNYLKPEVREAVIQMTLAVARRSPVVRFDAAMTLAKKHYQRLWFPEPGTGGDIASRADFGMTKAAFDAAMPEEFWREVVDRVAEEAPDTLLLAEAFWMMEGYFVRTLGMHRVYNSAFMNMLRDEKNGEYRQLIKNTLEFDPQILKRYVNFMNNPDERTAVDQFGKGDKYFGICTLMATLPGLPMFGHGQVEGFTEKYGMEYHRAYWNETPDADLVARHERQLFPLLHRRALFAEVDDFLLYDFFTADGGVDENVFAYSNRLGDARSLVVVHNTYAETRGWLRTSAAYAVKDDDGEKTLVQRSLAEGLALTGDPDIYVTFRDAVTGLEYIRRCKELVDGGWYVQLHAYQAHVFVDFREVHASDAQPYGQLAASLDGRGVPSIDEALKELLLAPILVPFRTFVNVDTFRQLVSARVSAPDEVVAPVLLDQIEAQVADFLRAAQVAGGIGGDVALAARGVRNKLATALAVSAILKRLTPSEAPEVHAAATNDILEGLITDSPATWGTLFGWIFAQAVGTLANETAAASEIGRSWVEDWFLGKAIADALVAWGIDVGAARWAVSTIKLLLGYRRWLDVASLPDVQLFDVLTAMLRERDVQVYIGVNRYDGVLWFNQESFEQLVRWVGVLAAVDMAVNAGDDFDVTFLALYDLVQRLLEAERASDYQVAKMMEAARPRM